jgi:hypothetical protein
MAQQGTVGAHGHFLKIHGEDIKLSKAKSTVGVSARLAVAMSNHF